VSEALTPLLLIAALVLCVAGAAKLRAPAQAAQAAAVLGLPGHSWLVRVLAVCELVLGGWVLVSPTRAGAVAIALLYACFALLSVVLARRRASCGCFGEGQSPASGFQAALSCALALIGAAAAVDVPGGAGWVLQRSAPQAFVVIAGVAAAVYATVLAYTALPEAWTAWSGR
jgi:Methylamine utilisation protein MauE